MTLNNSQIRVAGLRQALATADTSARLAAAFQAGTFPEPAFAKVLVEQCAIEPDFFVRDTLTWALTRIDSSATLDLLIAEVGSTNLQARSQALHTLSKIGDSRAWPVITADLLTDPDDQVARTAWRAAAALAPQAEKPHLAEILGTQFGRGDREVKLSLSRALVSLEDAAAPVIERAKAHRTLAVRAHAIATAKMVADPFEGFDTALAEAQRIAIVTGAPIPQAPDPTDAVGD